MLNTRVSVKMPRATAVQLSQALAAYTCQTTSRATTVYGLNTPTARRNFSLTTKTQLKERDVFPAVATPRIRRTEVAWPHPGYTEKQMTENVQIAHRKAENWSDWTALSMVRMLRWGTDLCTGYSHYVHPPKSQDGSTPPVKYSMNERKWLIRFIFLESVAGVPGMVGGMLRHLRSLRRMKRDNGWIETLLEEAYNERMHLLSFLKMAEPGWFMRLMVLGAQGVFFNAMFAAYLVSPRICHRFVGYLEEEACKTYTQAIQEIDLGLLPKWTTMPAPDLAVTYWHMPEGNQTIRDLLLYVRADEAKHREVNHTLANLHQATDPNPFASEYVDPSKPHPGKGLEHIRATGWKREEVI